MAKNNIVTCGEVFNVMDEYPELQGHRNAPCDTPWTFLVHFGNYTTFPEQGYGTCGFSTPEEAEKYRQRLLDEQPYSDKIVVVTKNCKNDHGNMHVEFHKAFRNVNEAIAYITSDSAFEGDKRQGKLQYGVNIYHELFCSQNFGSTYDFGFVDLD